MLPVIVLPLPGWRITTASPIVAILLVASTGALAVGTVLVLSAAPIILLTASAKLLAPASAVLLAPSAVLTGRGTVTVFEVAKPALVLENLCGSIGQAFPCPELQGKLPSGRFEEAANHVQGVWFGPSTFFELGDPDLSDFVGTEAGPNIGPFDGFQPVHHRPKAPRFEFELSEGEGLVPLSPGCAAPWLRLCGSQEC